MKKLISIFLYFFISFLFTNQYAYSWDNDITHMDLSSFSSEFSVLRSCINEDDMNCNYLKNIGFANGLGEYFQWGKYEKEAKEWIAEGAKYEDKPTLRSFNHFHNPLKQWNQAGLDEKLVVSLKGKSSLLWSQDGSYQQSSAGEDWSWQKTREYYYRALTSKTDSERRVNFSKTFRGLGHQIHLIQDKTVPDHVRNDAHPEDSLLGKDRINGAMFFETWAKNNPVIVNSHAAHAGQYLPNVSLDITLENLVPITQFYDTNQYTIGNPSQFFVSNQARSLTIGLAEYTNANFFSGDTIFAAERYSTDHRHYFPYPRKSSTDLQAYIDETKPLFTQIAEDGIKDKGLYIKKIRDGEIINHFVRTSRWTGKIYKVLGEGSLFYRSFYRDEKCHEDYASKLIPRAVGYSTGLLNYFFRGDIYMVPNDSGPGFVIENNSDEDMSGTFELWYDDAHDRKKAWGSELSIGKKSKSTNISSTFPAADKYILVFQGKMGNEDGAVVGKIIEKRKFLFLVNLDQQVLSFQIKPKNNQYQLIPLSKNINIKTNSSSSQLIVQSHPDQNEHVVIKPYSAIMYKPQITGFGVRSGIGTQYVYRPQSFSKNSPYRLYTTAFYPINIYSYSDLEAVGRKSYTLSDDKTQMVSYGNSIWKKLHEPMTCSGNVYEEGRTCNEKEALYMKYVDSTNKLVNGPTLGIDEFSIYEYYGIPSQKVIRNWTEHVFVATISNDKAIYKKSTPNYEWNYSYYGYSIGGDDNCCNISVVTQTDEMSNEVKLIIGGTSILSKTGEGMADNINTVWRYKRGYHSSCKDIKDYVSENTQYSIDVIDYDNLYNDENIILFYKVQEQIDSQERHETKGPCIEMSESSYKETTLTTTYHLYYKSSSISNVINLPFVETYHSENQDGTITETRSGERITGVSSQINDENIVYTYVAERLNEGTGEWNFIKRIIGIINRADPRLAVGYRQEFEISEGNASDVLTDIYADYEYKDLAAIGVHVE